MNWAVYNESNWSAIKGGYFKTYFKTKKEAIAFAEKIGNAIIEKKMCDRWIKIES